VELYEQSSGKTVEVPDDQAQQAFSSGGYGVTTAKVDVRGADGKLRTTDAKNLQRVLGAGYSLVPPSAATQERLEAKYGSPSGQAIAGAEGFLRGLTLGGSDYIAEGAAGALGRVQSAFGEDHGTGEREDAYAESVREHLQGYKEANKVTSTVGELAGAVAPIVASGGAAAPEEAAAIGGRGLVSSAEGAKALTTGAQAAEAATAGASRASGLSRAIQTLGAPQLGVMKFGDVAERLTTRAMEAALGESSGAGLAKAVTKVMGTGARGAAEGALYGVGQQLNEDVLGDHEINGEKLFAAGVYGGLLGAGVGGGLGALGQVAKGAAPLIRGKGGALRDMAETQGFRSMSLNLKDVKAIEKITGGTQGAAREFMDAGLIKAGDKVENLLPRFQAAEEAAGQALGDVRATLEAANLTPSVEDITSKLTPIREELEKLPNSNRGARREFDWLHEDLTTSMGDRPSFQGLAEFRTSLGKKINWRAAPGENAANDIKKTFYNALRDHEMDALDSSAAKAALGPKAAADMRQKLLSYRRLTTATRGIEDRVSADARNRVMSPSDYGVGAAAGAGLLASGNPLGALTGLASSIGHNILRTRGNATMAVVLDKIADMAGIAKRVESFDARVKSGVEKFMLRKQMRKVTSLGEFTPSNDNYQATVKRVQAISADSRAHEAAVAHHLGSVASVAPKTTQAFAKTATVAQQFMQSKVPTSQKFSTDDLQPHLHEARVSDADKAKFMRYARATHDPASVVDDMAEGRLTPEGVEALRAVYPGIFEQIKAKAIERIADEKAPIGYDKRVQMGILLGIPTDKTLNPQFIASMQSTFGKPPTDGPQAPQPAGAPKRQLKLADNLKLAGR